VFNLLFDVLLNEVA